MTLTEIRLRLQELGIRPSRRLGQNFLFDQNVAQRIVELGQLRPADNVVEIGPGLGALTQYLSEAKAQLTLMEADHRLAPWLRERYPEARLLEGDAVEELEKLRSTLSDAVVISNLPYSVASTLIVSLCEREYRPRKMVFTIQLEVAERLVAKPQSSDYGLLTLLTQPFYEIVLERKLSASVFWPQPEVTSAVVSMTRREVQPFESAEGEARFRGLVREAFQKRRKTLGAIFSKRLPGSLDPKKRPEEISMFEWAEAARPAPGQLPGSSEELFDIVNEKDEVVGQQPRSEVHRKGLWHRAVHIFVRNRKGQLLLQKRSVHKDVSPNTWDSSAAGHLCVGEAYAAAAEREIEEELGVKPALSPVTKLAACEELGWEFVCLFEGKSEGPFHFPESEISAIRWWTIEEIDRAIEEKSEEFAKSFCYLWRQWRKGRSMKEEDEGK